MMITFFAVTYFLCAFLISMFLNSVSSGVAGRLSDNAEIITVNQDHNSESALTYSDIGDILSKYKAVGAIKLVIEYNSGYALFDYEKTSSENSAPTAVIKPELEPYCMTINGRKTINFIGQNYTVSSINIYGGKDSDFILQSDKLSGSTVRFSGLTLIIDNKDKTPSVTESIKSDITGKNPDTNIRTDDISKIAGKGNLFTSGNIVIIIAILLIGLLILMNSGVFTWSWINSKRSEIMARRICGADDADIKKMIFINFLMISAVGILIGFIVTLLLTLIPAVSYYLGNIRISAGLISVAFILLIGGIISYSLSDKYSHEQVISLRRVIIIAILLIGLLILMNSGVFTWSWINSKRSEIMARRICGADDADIKKMIFINFLMISAVGILIGFIVTLLLTLIPAVSYYLGNIRISAGLISVAFILLIGGIISYSLSDKYSHEQVISLRRVL